MKTKLTTEQKQAFADHYLMIRENTNLSISKAYFQARADFHKAGKAFPAYSTFLKWLKFGINTEEKPERDSDIPTCPPLNLEDQAPQETEPAANPEDFRDQSDLMEEQQQQTDREKILFHIVKLYRFRREQDIDQIADDFISDWDE